MQRSIGSPGTCKEKQGELKELTTSTANWDGSYGKQGRVAGIAKVGDLKLASAHFFLKSTFLRFLFLQVSKGCFSVFR